MNAVSRKAFLDDSYLTACEGRVLFVNQQGGIVLDETNFYATSGGQPGDTGELEREDGSRIRIAATVYGETREQIVLVPDDDQQIPKHGERLICHIDWERRYKLMRMHTACHLLSVVCPFPITSANVNESESRVDFDLPDAGVTKETVTSAIMELVKGNHPVWSRWIDEDELRANPDLVKSKNVRPPVGAGRIRLVCIGEDASIDSQPCGGTHVAETAEIGEIHIGKIEKKGRENRRFRLRFGPSPG